MSCLGNASHGERGRTREGVREEPESKKGREHEYVERGRIGIRFVWLINHEEGGGIGL